jgi:hypothetical protein
MKILTRVPFLLAFLVALLPVCSFMNYRLAQDTAAAPGELGDDITLSRDSRGIYTVEADDLENALFATGYLHGRDRGTQLLSIRSRLRRYSRRVPRDIRKKEISLSAILHSNIPHRVTAAMDPETRILLESYAKGVNRGLSERPGSLVFSMLFPGRWSGEDSVGILIMINHLLEAGSNAWVASDAGGRVILAGDPHLDMGSVPGYFYAINLMIRNSDDEAGVRRLTALGPPGIPMFSLASGSSIGWALTSLYFPYVREEIRHWTRTDGGSLVLQSADGSRDVHETGTWHRRGDRLIIRTDDGTTIIASVVSDSMVISYDNPWMHPEYIRYGSLLKMPMAEDVEALADLAAEFSVLPYLFTAGDSSGKIAQFSGFDPLFYRSPRWSVDDLRYIEADSPAFLQNANDIPVFLANYARASGLQPINRYRERAAIITAHLTEPLQEGPMRDFRRWQTDPESIFTPYQEKVFDLVMESFSNQPITQNDLSPPHHDGFTDQRMKGEAELFGIIESMIRGSIDIEPGLRASWRPEEWVGAALLNDPNALREAPLRLDLLSLRQYRHDFASETGLRMVPEFSGADSAETAFASDLPWDRILYGRASRIPFSAPPASSYGLAVHLPDPWNPSGFFSAAARLVGEISPDGEVFLTLPPGQSERLSSSHSRDFVEDWAGGRYYRMEVSGWP